MFLGGNFVGGEMVWWRGDGIPSDRGVRREVREREKIRGRRGRGREKGTRSSASLPTYPTPRCLSCSRLSAPSHNLNAWNRLALLQCNMLLIVFIAGQSLDEHNTAFQQSFVSALSHWELRW